MAEKKKEEVTEEMKFDKIQIVSSKAFRSWQDLLNGNLVDGTQYSISEVETLIDDFKKGKVKK